MTSLVFDINHFFLKKQLFPKESFSFQPFWEGSRACDTNKTKAFPLENEVFCDKIIYTENERGHRTRYSRKTFHKLPRVDRNRS